MTPEASLYLAKARDLLAQTDTMLSVDLFEAAGRNAYLAGFHAAQALIAERTGRAVKTHNGVRTLFQSLTKDDPHFPGEQRAFLAKSFNLKSIADYETGPGEVSRDRAAEAVAAACDFVAAVERVLTL